MKKIWSTLFITVCLWQPIMAQQILPKWKKGNLDILVMKTGRGDAIFTIMPDGTTMLTDPGEMDLTDNRTWSDRNSKAYPNAAKFADQWIADYINQVNPNSDKNYIDFAYITHFHDDHYGMVFNGARQSKTGNYLLSGITGVGERIRFGKLVDRGFPDYNKPIDIKIDLQKRNKKEYRTLMNYLDFIAEKQKTGMIVEGFKVGDKKQFALQYDQSNYPLFKITNIHGNGYYWDKKSNRVVNAYPTDGSFEPSENGLSCGILIEYGKFKFFHGGDIPGVPNVGTSMVYDMESKIAPSIGAVDVAMTNHHAGRDVLNPTFISTLQPRAWFQVVWSSDQPNQETLMRLLSPALYTGPRDLFATDILPSNRLVIGDLIDRAYKSTDKHIWLQVQENGIYQIHTLETKDDKLVLCNTFGPYNPKVN